MAVNYEKRIKQLDAQRASCAARFDKATRKAEADAKFMAGELLLQMLPDWRGVKWEQLDDYLHRQKTVEFFTKHFYTTDWEAGVPGKRLKDYKGGK